MPTDRPRVSRRRLLRDTAALGTLAALAGCTDDGDEPSDSDDENPDDEAADDENTDDGGDEGSDDGGGVNY